MRHSPPSKTEPFPSSHRPHALSHAAKPKRPLAASWACNSTPEWPPWGRKGKDWLRKQDGVRRTLPTKGASAGIDPKPTFRLSYVSCFSITPVGLFSGGPIGEEIMVGHKKTRKQQDLHPSLLRCLGIEDGITVDEIMRFFSMRTRWACKPCWELKYCPYGPLVEQSPLLPPDRESATAHNEYLKNCLETGTMWTGQALDGNRRKYFIECVSNFDIEQYPMNIPEILREMQCDIFGHICPVVFVGEDATETSEARRRGRYIPFDVKMRVARRDNVTCQECGKPLRDNEIEFDHTIPVSKGGSSDEGNIRVTWFKCKIGRASCRERV